MPVLLELEGVLLAALVAATNAQPSDPVQFAINYLQHEKSKFDLRKQRSAAKIQSIWRGRRDRVHLHKQASHAGSQINMLLSMDPGQDLDDEMALVLLATLSDRGLVSCGGVITCLAPAGMRARLARGTLDNLGLHKVPVAAGTDGGSSGDAAAMSKIEYLTELIPQEDAGVEFMRDVLSGAPDQSYTIVVVSSLKDVAALLRQHESLFKQKVLRVVIQGGVTPFTPGVAPGGTFLEPDTAHNNEFDREASAFFYRRCQEIKVPLVVVSRFAAYAAPLPRSIYDEMAATESPIGLHLQGAQRRSIEQLWKRACAPDGSDARSGLPARCDKPWFVATFCGGNGAERTGSDSIWDLIESFNAYDPLAVIVAIPALTHMFEFTKLEVNGVVHRVVGISKESNGVVGNGDRLQSWMKSAFLNGVQPLRAPAAEAQASSMQTQGGLEGKARSAGMLTVTI